MSTANIRLVNEVLRNDCQDQNTKRRLNGLNYLLLQHSYLSFVSPCSSSALLNIINLIPKALTPLVHELDALQLDYFRIKVICVCLYPPKMLPNSGLYQQL